MATEVMHPRTDPHPLSSMVRTLFDFDLRGGGEGGREGGRVTEVGGGRERSKCKPSWQQEERSPR